MMGEPGEWEGWDNNGRGMGGGRRDRTVGRNGRGGTRTAGEWEGEDKGRGGTRKAKGGGRGGRTGGRRKGRKG